MDQLNVLLCVIFGIMLFSDWTSAMPKIKRRLLTAEEQLIKYLFSGYEKDARSVRNTTFTVTVTVQFLLLRIQQLDERSQVLLTTGLVLTDWRDERFVWNPSEFNNITDVVVRAERIWTPELAIINGANDMIQDFERIRVLISSNGGVHWEPGGIFATTCDIDITFFPFDTQACTIAIGAWAYKSSRMNLTNADHTIEMDQFRVNGEWEVIGTTAIWEQVVLPCCPDIRYSKVVFTIYMNRRYTFYIVNIIMPCALLSTLILIVFCVPPDAGEKISAGISVLLAFTVFLLMLADNVPRTSLDTPVLVIYLASTMALGTGSVCLTVVVLHIHYKGSQTRVPKWVRIFFLDKIARLLCLQEVYMSPFLQKQRKKHLYYQQQRMLKQRMQQNNIIRQETTFTSNSNDVRTYTTTTTQNDLLNLNDLYHNHQRQEYDNQRQQHNNAFNFSQGNSTAADSSPYDSMLYERTNKKKSHNGRGGKYSSAIVDSDGADEPDEAIIVKEWKLLARVVDRIFFYLVFMIMFISASCILLSPWYAAKHIFPKKQQNMQND